MKIHVGTSGFGHKEWKGKFYPEKIAAKDMLRFYAGRLNTVEINNTFYHMPQESVLLSWAEQVPEDFVFALKAPQVITHFKQLRNVFEETEYLFRTLSILGEKLGPVLFQFPKSFRANAPALEDFLPLIPGNALCAFDFRSPTWLEGGIPDLLRKKGCSWCLEDTDELSQWAERVLSQKWERAFVFFKHEDEAKGPEQAMRFQELVDSRGEKTRKAG
jgi:uncharacterized protein YecE (DUF72 family)